MKLKDALKLGINSLVSANIEAPANNAGAVLCHVLNCSRTFLYVHDEYILTDQELEAFLNLVEKRSKGKPLQYITGHQEFMSLDFFVTEDVLIPRQDTEILVETAMQYSKQFDSSKIKILEIGAGSGCISVSLAHYIGRCCITAVDISEKALEVAEKNAVGNGVADKIKFVKSDLFTNLKDDIDFDIIISNPPYIPSKDITDLQIEVREFEPKMALDGGEDGLDFYRKIIDRAPCYQKSGGILAFEVGYDQAQKVETLMRENYCDTKIFKDLSKVDRVVVGRLK